LVLDLITVVLILGIISVVGGVIFGLKVVSQRGSTVESKSFSSRLGYLNDENGELKKYLKSLKGQLAQTKQGPTMDEGETITEEGFDSTIKSLIGKYASMAPKRFQFLLRDPAIVNFLISEAKKHPEQTKEVLSHFIGKNGNVDTTASSDESQQREVEEYYAASA